MRRIPFLPGILVLGFLCLAAGTARAHENEVNIFRQGDALCFRSNATPPHDIGQFPNRGNPHRFQSQSLSVCVPGTPERTGTIDRRASASGVTLAGILIRPGTADFYDAQSPRGHSRNPSSGWRLDGMNPDNILGLDANAAHVDHRGLYHYHGVTDALTVSANATLIGYAADGFEIHLTDGAQSSWRLRQGRRQSAPFGQFDGTYEQDWIYVPGSGNLDECNGAEVNGRYVYFATDSYPFFPRCFVGTVSDDFKVRP